MSGRPLNSVRAVPASLLRHLGRELDITTPDLVSLRALYSRGRTLFDHQQQACQALGFAWMTEHQRRALVRVLRDEVARSARRQLSWPLEILVDAVGKSGLSPLAVVMMLMVMYLVLGSIFDTISSMVITMPFVFPLIVGYRMDPIWWGVINVMVIEIGMITPPIGLNVFVMKAMLPNTQLSTIFRGVAPFIAADLLRLPVLILFPALAVLLPNLLDLLDLPR